MRINPISYNNNTNFNGTCVAAFTQTGILRQTEKGWPDNYIFERTIELVKKPVKKYAKTQGQNQMTIVEYLKLKASYYINYLWASGNGDGTKHVQEVLEKSLKDSRTEGRIVLDALMIDGKTSPAGFYYKLGFRFANSKYNKIMENWLNKSGSKKDAPNITGIMYLPKENIEHCLRY